MDFNKVNTMMKINKVNTMMRINKALFEELTKPNQGKQKLHFQHNVEKSIMAKCFLKIK